MLINVSGVNPIRSWLASIPVRVLIDTDPVFTQCRHLNDAGAYAKAARHNAYFSFGELIETSESAIPEDQFGWRRTRQPVVLDLWPFSEGPADGAFTTIMQWDSYPAVEWNGHRFGMKSESFDVLRDVASSVRVPLEIALGGTSAPRRQLKGLGWRIVDPLHVTRDLWSYQQYLRASRGELSVAKQGYVAARCGWFSERTACYLATGRPAIVQDTGFSRFLPCGEGLWAFDDMTSAMEAIETVVSNYEAQCRSARAIARELFDSRHVLTSLLDRAFALAGTSSSAAVAQ
jgi:hypothetical protein